jgi:hypothetical protein
MFHWIMRLRRWLVRSRELVLNSEQIRQSSLEEWYKDYLSEDTKFTNLHDVVDILDEECLERQIQEFMPSIQIQDGYCTVCQEFLKAWFKMIGPHNQQKTKSFDLPWHVNFTQFEASSRRSCQFCKVWLQGIKHDGSASLQRFRTIEQGLHYLGKPHFLSIKTESRGKRYCMCLNYPGTTFRSYDALPFDAIRMKVSGLDSIPPHNLG